MGIGEACHQPNGLDSGGRTGNGGGDPTASTEGRGGVGVRRWPVDTSGHGGHATAATTAIAEGEGRSAEAIVSLIEAEAPALAPRKALKVSTSSTARWVVEAQAAIQRGAALARADPKEPVAQGEAAEVVMKEVGEEAPKPYEADAHESDKAEVPSVAEATEGEAEAPRTSEAEVVEVEASRPSEAEVAEARALGTSEAEAVEAGVGAAKPANQDTETEAGQASVPPLVQDPPPSQGSPGRWRSI
ncbi:fruit protein pKIWI501-like [Miscanthus floridulus]|uniref:fruit protein pKIWI501-like n=1 Tax=Miscanthus floridulus TaxID=154761 RepID=UPI00345AD5DA